MKECDLVMKGGTTSGVVYPQAIYRIGKEYRLRSVGGSSAGAIAATVAAAAEYRRQTSPGKNDESGYEEVAALSNELGADLTRYLQPSRELAPLFDAFIAYQRARQEEEKPSWFKLARVVWPYLKSYRQKALQNGGLIAGFGAVLGVAGAGFGIGVLGVAAGVLWGFVQFFISLVTTISAQLKAQDYGMVPGTTEFGRGDPSVPAISDWLTDRIDAIAGIDTDDPLTVGDLCDGRNNEVPGIEIATMTTDLTSQRPYSLPLKMHGQYFFNQEEFVKILPRRVVNYMVRVSQDGEVSGPSGKTLYPVPVGAAFPVVLTARMSLSFPILLQAVPLYRRDSKGSGENNWERCLFSDGGIASNLPVHFFDAWLPRRPTFAISLGSFDKERHSESEDRVHFDQGIRDRLDLPVQRFDGLLGFLFSIFNTAKDWQDKLQTEIPGMYERVVTVRLESHQGGSNIAMPAHIIQQLKEYGDEAGRKLVDEFHFDESRWRRALCLLPELEFVMPRVRDAVRNNPAGPHDRTYQDLVQHYRSQLYPNDPPWPEDFLLPLLHDLAELGEKIAVRAEAREKVISNTPDYDADLRLVASPDLSPGSGSQRGASA